MNADPAREWARNLIDRHACEAAQSLRRFARKPASAKRLHRARRDLARLRAAIDDVGETAGARKRLRRCVQELHSRAGKVRDADVLLARVTEYTQRALGMEADELEDVARMLCKRREKACVKLRALMERMPDLRV
jgi:CHAD domain-containing protein